MENQPPFPSEETQKKECRENRPLFLLQLREPETIESSDGAMTLEARTAKKAELDAVNKRNIAALQPLVDAIRKLDPEAYVQNTAGSTVMLRTTPEAMAQARALFPQIEGKDRATQDTPSIRTTQAEQVQTSFEQTPDLRTNYIIRFKTEPFNTLRPALIAEIQHTLRQADPDSTFAPEATEHPAFLVASITPAAFAAINNSSELGRLLTIQPFTL